MTNKYTEIKIDNKLPINWYKFYLSISGKLFDIYNNRIINLIKIGINKFKSEYPSYNLNNIHNLINTLTSPKVNRYHNYLCEKLNKHLEKFYNENIANYNRSDIYHNKEVYENMKKIVFSEDFSNIVINDVFDKIKFVFFIDRKKIDLGIWENGVYQGKTLGLPYSVYS